MEVQAGRFRSASAIRGAPAYRADRDFGGGGQALGGGVTCPWQTAPDGVGCALAKPRDRSLSSKGGDDETDGGVEHAARAETFDVGDMKSALLHAVGPKYAQPDRRGVLMRLHRLTTTPAPAPDRYANISGRRTLYWA